MLTSDGGVNTVSQLLQIISNLSYETFVKEKKTVCFGSSRLCVYMVDFFFILS